MSDEEIYINNVNALARHLTLALKNYVLKHEAQMSTTSMLSALRLLRKSVIEASDFTTEEVAEVERLTDGLKMYTVPVPNNTKPPEVV